MIVSGTSTAPSTSLPMRTVLVSNMTGTTEDEVVGWQHRLSGQTQLSKLQESVMSRETWRAAVHMVAESRTRLND